MDDLKGLETRGYKLIERIGEGGFGVVYRAEQPAVGREVAIKVILPEHTKHPEFVARFETEARMVAKLEHPHIVPLYDYWRDEEDAYLVMRWLRGGSLREVIDSGPCEVEATDRLLGQIAKALSMAHKQGVVHRDLKPENILFDEDGNAYLTDFGIAKELGEEGLTKTGKIVGSVDYLAPEQAKGEPVTPMADIYGLGVVLYEILVGEHPFPGLTPVQLLQKHLYQPLPSIRASRPNLSEALNDVIQRATAKNPAERYSNVIELREAYKQALALDKALNHETQLPSFLKEGEEGREVERPVFVGRERELAQLDGYLTKALAGHQQVIFVTGGAGSGKTALVDEFSRRALDAHGDLIVAMGNCNAQTGIGDPYLPFRDVFGMLTGDVEAKWISGGITRENAKRLWEVLPLTLDALLARGPSLVDVFISGEVLLTHAKVALSASSEQLKRLIDLFERRKTVITELEQSLLFEQCTNVLNIISHQRPLVLIMDDLQWADDASISLLFHLGRRIEGNPILVIGAYRPEEVALGRGDDKHPLESVVNELKMKYGDIILDLSQEKEAEGQKFVEDLLDTEPNSLSSEFRQAIFKRTNGHPLFTVELLRTMQERGNIVKDDQGRWMEGTSLSWDTLPARVEAAIEERINRLEDESRESLSVASVEGEDFTAQVVARVQEIKERRLIRKLSQELEKRHRLVRERGEYKIDGQLLSRYRFAHHLFQRYLYNELSIAERRMLHGEIAEAIEELFERNTNEIAVQLAFHYRQAGNNKKALHYLTQAGHKARASYANEEAARYYTEALALLPRDHPDRFHLLASRAAVYDLIALREKQLADTEAMLVLAEESDDDVRRCDALVALADYYLDTEHLHAEAPSERALNIARRIGDPVREGHALRRLGQCLYNKEDFLRSPSELKAAVESFRESGLLGEAVNCLQVLSLSFGRLGDRTTALEVAEEAVALSREMDDSRQVATSLRMLAIALHNQSKYPEALPFAMEALELHCKLGDRAEECKGLNLLGVIHAWIGNMAMSEDYLHQALVLSESISLSASVRYAMSNLLYQHIYRRGEYEAALSFLEERLLKARSTTDDWLILHTQLQKSYALEFLGKYEEALEVLNSISLSLERFAGPSLQVEVKSTIGTNHTELGNYSKAREILQGALDIAEKNDSSDDIAWALKGLAYVSLIEGEAISLRSGLEMVNRAVALSREASSVINLITTLNIEANLFLALGQIDEAFGSSTEVQNLMKSAPYPFEPEKYFFTHFRILRMLDREAEADDYLYRAYERVMLVANNTRDDELKQSWLENVKVNREILEACKELGIHV